MRRCPNASALPPQSRDAMAAAYVKARAPRLDARLERQPCGSSALALIADIRFAAPLRPRLRAEAPLAGRIATPRRRAGSRLWPDRPPGRARRSGPVADFKTTARPPREGEPAPQSYVTQLALYRAVLRETLPGEAGAGLRSLWTAGPVVQEIVRRRARLAWRPLSSGVRPSRCLIRPAPFGYLGFSRRAIALGRSPPTIRGDS